MGRRRKQAPRGACNGFIMAVSQAGALGHNLRSYLHPRVDARPAVERCVCAAHAAAGAGPLGMCVPVYHVAFILKRKQRGPVTMSRRSREDVDVTSPRQISSSSANIRYPLEEESGDLLTYLVGIDAWSNQVKCSGREPCRILDARTLVIFSLFNSESFVRVVYDNTAERSVGFCDDVLNLLDLGQKNTDDGSFLTKVKVFNGKLLDSVKSHNQVFDGDRYTLNGKNLVQGIAIMVAIHTVCVLSYGRLITGVTEDIAEMKTFVKWFVDEVMKWTNSHRHHKVAWDIHATVAGIYGKACNKVIDDLSQATELVLEPIE